MVINGQEIPNSDYLCITLEHLCFSGCPKIRTKAKVAIHVYMPGQKKFGRILSF